VFSNGLKIFSEIVVLLLKSVIESLVVDLDEIIFYKTLVRYIIIF